ncbi:MAG: sulfatase [Gracilimonas sp.]|uniref:sulfatase family protein n=1 Tax=Gracilimonas sp. TaxID=1974203 RepID=UPI0019CA0F72|nr:sulfatase [Gracilimonas sp.]MBD3615068.1 sulfatase [Gracilimonas sp.]
MKKPLLHIIISTVIITVISLGYFLPAVAQTNQPQNVVFILSDDHRYDFMGFHENAPSYIETPNLDRMAAEGMHIKNAFVTTSLCSPSRASILTGQYAHNHQVVDNTSPIPEATRFFNEDIQQNGYQTAYIGKWHMGEVDDSPRPGWDRWVSFRGQGVYSNPTLNVDGKRDEYVGYTTDILTDFAEEWLEERSKNNNEPFFLYLSHKAVHAEFEPAERHEGHYADIDIEYPESMDKTERNYRTKPDWVKAQRNSWHGVDYPYHGEMNFDEFYRKYITTLLALDESVGRILNYLEESGLAENTLVIYMADNGFLHGEHGLIDKRNAYEESIRVPMLAWGPGYVEAGSQIDELVRNIDIAPTILELFDTNSSIDMDGLSFLSLLSGKGEQPDREFLYEYYWEPAFPHTPTTFSIRGDRYKYIFYHGVWDRDELYDLQEDPQERYNLAEVPHYIDLRNEMRTRLFDKMEEQDAMSIPVRRAGWQADEKLIDN